MESPPRLGREVFVALAAIGWADGKLDHEEADAIVRTALEEGLELDAIEEIERATRTRVELDSLQLDGMTKEDRLFVYGVAAWMTRLDGQVAEAELAALGRLGDLLRIPAGPRQAVDAVAQEIALLPEGDRPARYDLSRLRANIAERLERSRAKG